MRSPILGIVVPCYNEEEVLVETANRLLGILTELTSISRIRIESFIIFVDDGSVDKTWNIINNLKQQNENHIKGLKLSRNFGHQNALLAGMIEVKNFCDCIISIDADLQQDEKAIIQFVDKFIEGYEIVYGVRSDRSADKFFKRNTASLFYKMMRLFGVDILENHADFRLMGKRAIEALSNYEEVNLFLRGMFPLLGFKTSIIHFSVRERFAGESKYTLKKMLRFAFEGITSFSTVPIQFISFIGFIIFILSLVMSGYTVYSKIVDNTLPGWASTLLPIYFLGGIQLLSLGIIGEYIGKIYKETKKRPRYIIEEVI